MANHDVELVDDAKKKTERTDDGPVNAIVEYVADGGDYDDGFVEKSTQKRSIVEKVALLGDFVDDEKADSEQTGIGGATDDPYFEIVEKKHDAIETNGEMITKTNAQAVETSDAMIANHDGSCHVVACGAAIANPFVRLPVELGNRK